MIRRRRSPSMAGSSYDDIMSNSEDCEYAAASSAAASLPPQQWSDVIQYLTTDELKALRLAGNKEMHLSHPSLTRHLSLRMDRAAFFAANGNSSLDQAKEWLANRRSLVIDDNDVTDGILPRMCSHRVAYLVENGYLDSVTELVVFDCHLHRRIFALLTRLPNLKSLRLASHASRQEEGVLDELELIVSSVGSMHSLKHLDIEFDCVVNGSRLSFLTQLRGLTHLRLRGFDLSDGIRSMAGLGNLQSLELCHGNFFESPTNEANETDLAHLTGLTKVQALHLEGFDGLSEVGLKPFATPLSCVEHLVLKHCQEMDEGCLTSIGRMSHLTALHIVHSAYDDVTVLDAESLRSIHSLVGLTALSLFYVLDDPSDLQALWGLTSLETLNVAFEEDLCEGDVEEGLCRTVLPAFKSLRKLRVFSEEGMGHSCRHGGLEVEYAPFEFGDLVRLD